MSRRQREASLPPSSESLRENSLAWYLLSNGALLFSLISSGYSGGTIVYREVVEPNGPKKIQVTVIDRELSPASDLEIFFPEISDRPQLKSVKFIDRKLSIEQASNGFAVAVLDQPTQSGAEYFLLNFETQQQISFQEIIGDKVLADVPKLRQSTDGDMFLVVSFVGEETGYVYFLTGALQGKLLEDRHTLESTKNQYHFKMVRDEQGRKGLEITNIITHRQWVVWSTPTVEADILSIKDGHAVFSSVLPINGQYLVKLQAGILHEPSTQSSDGNFLISRSAHSQELSLMEITIPVVLCEVVYVEGKDNPYIIGKDQYYRSALYRINFESFQLEHIASVGVNGVVQRAEYISEVNRILLTVTDIVTLSEKKYLLNPESHEPAQQVPLDAFEKIVSVEYGNYQGLKNSPAIFFLSSIWSAILLSLRALPRKVSR